MKVSDVQRGKATLMEVRPASHEGFGSLGALTEVEIYT
jgi:hypothetical protein